MPAGLVRRTATWLTRWAMAGRIPQNFINDLLARVDIVDVVGERVKLKRSGKNHTGLCPFHNEKTPSFSVSADKQFYHCFGCRESGTALTFLMAFDGLEFVEAVEHLAQTVGLEVPREAVRAGPSRAQMDVHALVDRVSRHYQTHLRGSPRAIEYLKRRGVTGIVARDFALGYAIDAWDDVLKSFPDQSLLEAAGLLSTNDRGRVYDRFRDRLMFPIRDTRGRVIGFGGRMLSDGDGPKYLNSPETDLFHKGRELYGLFEARRSVRQLVRLIVVEGYMDVIALAQAGVPNAVATLGTAMSSDHFRKSFRYVSEVVCCFDGDRAGRQAAWRALESALPTLEDGRQVRFVFLPDGEDPDTYVRSRSPGDFERLVEQAVPAVEYLFSYLEESADLASLDGKARFAAAMEPFISRMPDGILRSLVVRRLEEATGYRRSAGTPPRESRPRTAGTPGELRLQKRLLSPLLTDPGLWGQLSCEVRQELLDGVDSGDPFGAVIRILESRPDADVAEILGATSGERWHEWLTRVAHAPSELPPDSRRVEFLEGVQRMRGRLADSQRKRLLEEIRSDPSRERLREHFERRRGELGPNK